MNLTPRPYQSKVISDARSLLRALKPQGRKPRIVLRMPPRSGKTATAAFMAHSAMLAGRNVAFLAHRDFLIGQAGRTFDEAGIPYSYLAAGKHTNKYMRCHLGMFGSMKTRQALIKPPDLAFIDECHHTPAKTWREVVEAWPDTTFIGLSATPSHRMDGQGLDKLFDGIVHGPHEAELMAMGALSDYIWYAPSAPDMSKIHTRAGEYVTSEVADEMSKAVIVADIVDSYRKYADGTIAVYFAANIATSKLYAERFNAAGIPAVHLDKDSSTSERANVFRRLANGTIKIVCNVALFGEGLDIKAYTGLDVTIETVGLCRPTKSFPFLVQMAMRPLNPKPYPGIILDHAGCFAEHQWMPDDEIDWTLAGAAERAKREAWQCDGCGAMNKLTDKECVSCKSPKPIANRGAGEQRELLHVDGDMIRIDREARKAAEAASKKGETQELAHLVAMAVKQGYKNPHEWAHGVVAQRMAAAYRR